MLNSPLVATEDSCTEPYCRIQRAADTLLYYVSGASDSPWYLSPDYHVIADNTPVHVSASDPQSPSQVILDAEYIAFAQPDLLMGVVAVLVERAEIHKLGECYYCNTKHEECPTLLLSDTILAMPERIRETPATQAVE